MSPKKHSKLSVFLKGMAMGAADVVPGVSGGTIAFITGIYDTLIDSIARVGLRQVQGVLYLFQGIFQKEKFKEGLQRLNEIHWAFFLPLLIGIFTAIATLAKVIPGLMQNYPLQTYSVFFGLILASIPVPLKGIRVGVKEGILVVISALAMFFLMGFGSELQGSLNPFYLFLCGMIAICALILPGVSGSYLLVLLGQYKILLEAIHQKDFLSLGLFLSGMLVGVFSFIRILKYLLTHYRSKTMCLLTGIIAGSLRVIWPLKYTPETGVSDPVMTSVPFVIAGLILVFVLERLGSRTSEKKS